MACVILIARSGVEVGFEFRLVIVTRTTVHVGVHGL